jgi:chromosome segregation and condensation protein ScpB
MKRAGTEPDLDRELADLPADLRWREWLRRVEAVLFASAGPVPRAALAQVVGQGVAVDLLIADLAADLGGRPYEVARAGAGWMLRTRAAYAPAIRAAAGPGQQAPQLPEFDLAVLAAIALRQPVSRADLRDIFGRDIGRDLIGRLVAAGLIGSGPRVPLRGAPHSFVTTDRFLAVFGLETLQDLDDAAQPDAGPPPGAAAPAP